MGQIDDGIFVGRRRIIDLQLIVIRQRVRDLDRQIPGIAFLPVLAQIVQLQRCSAGGGNVFRLPNHFVKAPHATVQVVLSVVFRKRVGGSIQRELAMRDPIGITANRGAEIGFVMQIPIKIVVSKDDIIRLSVPIGHF